MKYPKLEPVPIQTKGLSLFKRMRVWLFSSRKWKVTEDWEFETKFYEKNITVFIHKGFVFDGASIPRPLWPLLSPVGVLLIPGLIHDYGYRHQHIVDISDPRIVNNRIYSSSHKVWDKLFRDVSVQVNGCKVISYSAWMALVVFGNAAWKKNRKLELKEIHRD